MAETTATPVDLLASLHRRVDARKVKSEVRDLARTAREIIARYRGGLPAEISSRNELLSQLGLRNLRGYSCRHCIRPAIRRAIMRRRGRRIELAGLLKQRRSNGLPAWAIVDPRFPISHANGSRCNDGSLYINSRRYRIADLPGDGKEYIPDGMPVLPARVRALVQDKKILRRAKWIGVLYQPESWREVKPDPAVVAEWLDLPGEYYALAVWGGDRAKIMEWVD